ncbi:MAG: hypothetical protein QGI83_03670 [Candidatus Latescibacteria bacterium]|nr:hypothetical protein [Candidatus Latescibacterota bacterium]
MNATDRSTDGGVLTDRTGRWEHEAGLEQGEGAFGTEPNPTGNPIGGGEGYSEIHIEGDCVADSYEALRDALGEAKSGEVVFIPGEAKICMDGHEALTIPEGVTVASSRGFDGSPGGMVYADDLSRPGMLSSGGDCVRVTGLRVRGPYPHRDRIDRSSSGLSSGHYATEIDNCEVSGFRASATSFRQGANRGYVHHNHIHHNQQAGLGYGVSLGGAFVLIEGNCFDWCRHHIASSGAPGSGYEARYNVCGENANGHLFDMHGGRDRGDATDIAGDWMNVHHNTIHCTEARSVGVRGVPSQGAKIHHNWFYSPDPANIVRTSGGTEAYQNVLGPDRLLLDRLEIENV